MNSDVTIQEDFLFSADAQNESRILLQTKSDESVELRGYRIAGNSTVLFSQLTRNRYLLVTPRDDGTIRMICNHTAAVVVETEAASMTVTVAVVVAVVALVCAVVVVVVAVCLYRRRSTESNLSRDRPVPDVTCKAKAQNEYDVTFSRKDGGSQQKSGAEEEQFMVDNDIYEGGR